MKSTLKLVCSVAALTMVCWIGPSRTAQAAYPACWDLRDCYQPGAREYCWNVNLELAICRCVNNWWYCSTAGF